MKKGVSPVVAIVLLIAIAVISAVAVWSWIGPLTSKPPMGATAQYSLNVEKCYADLNTVDIKNTGGIKISAQNFSLIDKSTGVPKDKENESYCWIRLFIEKMNEWVYECPNCN